MRHYGKSFYFASMVFSEATALKVFRLYQYCRYVDDCGDELNPIEGRRRLKELNEIIDGNLNTDLKDLERLVQNILLTGVKPEDLKVLITGALYESNGHFIASKKDLIHYCYLVAGVVGKMMCPLIGVSDEKASPYAIDLGIGMQLTNICRDVLEDSKNDRFYLWELELTKDNSLNTKSNKEIVLSYLKLADCYYQSAFRGLSYIPFRSRVAIFIASEVYRAIGKKIKSKGDRMFKERIYLNTLEKCWVCLKSSLKLFHPSFWRPRSHETSLHSDLKLKLESF